MAIDIDTEATDKKVRRQPEEDTRPLFNRYETTPELPEEVPAFSSLPTLPEGRKSEYNGSNIDYLSLQYKTLGPLINKFRTQGIEDELIESVLHEVDNEILFRNHPDAASPRSRSDLAPFRWRPSS
ncbi:hypothetical protein AGMMS50276_33110 [Synergistales bacterium]|nr:hypothetical protein AGMMS50276_33110 [Synergistales bacterium]